MQHFNLNKVQVFVAKKHHALTGSQSVRLLLQQALTQLHSTDTLNDSTLPYVLEPSNCLVSFSHSSQHIAVAIATSPLTGLGIDLEDKSIPMTVVKRFFSANEHAWLNQQPESTQANYARILWMTKEAYIKTTTGSLLNGLKNDVLSFVLQAIPLETLPNTHTKHHLLTTKTKNGLTVYFCNQFAVIWLENPTV